MARWDLLLWAAAAMACSSPGNGNETLTCSRSDRTGTYLLQLTEQSGDCGPIPDELGILDSANAPAPPGCTIAREVWEDGDCTLSREIQCDDGSSATAITTQEDSGGESFSGLFTLRGLDCTSTYDFRATRQ